MNDSLINHTLEQAVTLNRCLKEKMRLLETVYNQGQQIKASNGATAPPMTSTTALPASAGQLRNNNIGELASSPRSRLFADPLSNNIAAQHQHPRPAVNCSTSVVRMEDLGEEVRGQIEQYMHPPPPPVLVQEVAMHLVPQKPLLVKTVRSNMGNHSTCNTATQGVPVPLTSGRCSRHIHRCQHQPRINDSHYCPHHRDQSRR